MTAPVTACDPDQLAALARGGDPRALDAITRCYGERLVAIGRRACRDDTLGEDAAQDALVSAVEHLADWRGDGSIEAWLGRMVTNACWRLRRGRKNDPALHAPEVEVPDDVADPEREAARAELAGLLSEGLLALSPTDRAILLLSDVEGWKGPELAARLDVAPAVARKRLSRARGRLRAHMEAAGLG